MSVIGVLLLWGSQINIHPEGCIGDLKRLLWLFDIYQWCSRVHTIDLPENIFLSGGGKPYYSPQYSQGQVFRGLCCWKVPCQVWTEESNSAKKRQQQQDRLSLILKSAWKAWPLGKIGHITWRSDWTVKSWVHVTSWTRNWCRCQDHPVLTVVVQINYQNVHGLSWNHVVGIVYWPSWFNSSIFGF